MKTLKEYIEHLLSRGIYFLSQAESMSILGMTSEEFRFQAYRLSKKNALRRVKSDFFMIITPEYRSLGSLPTHWIIDALMKHLNQEYYIGLLSAAAFYGATEQQPMVFQVITNKQITKIKLPRTRIEFHVYKNCYSAAKTTLPVPTGYVKISKKEQTMLDLVRFYKISGYLSNVALVIKSLAEECDPEAFKVIIQKEQTNTVLQRLGYILEFIEQPKLAEYVERELINRSIEYEVLRPDLRNAITTKNKRWKLILNDILDL